MATSKRTLIATIGSGSSARQRELVVESLAVNGAASSDGTRWRVVVDGVERELDARRVGDGSWSVLVDGRSLVVDVSRGRNGALQVCASGAPMYIQLADPRRQKLAHVSVKKKGGPHALRAQMPGKIVKVMTKVGDAVKAGQGLVVVEAMKMENELGAGQDGVVKKIHVSDG